MMKFRRNFMHNGNLLNVAQKFKILLPLLDIFFLILKIVLIKNKTF